MRPMIRSCDQATPHREHRWDKLALNTYRYQCPGVKMPPAPSEVVIAPPNVGSSVVVWVPSCMWVEVPGTGMEVFHKCPGEQGVAVSREGGFDGAMHLPEGPAWMVRPVQGV